MKVIVVSSYPPRRCGIGAYAHAQVERLRAEGHETYVISPEDGDGDQRVDFSSGAPFRTALDVSGPEDRIVVHYQPALYAKPRDLVSRITSTLALKRLLGARPRTEVIVHEADPVRWWRPDELLLRAAFREARNLLFHTDRERTLFAGIYRPRDPGGLIQHGDGIALHRSESRPEARKRLGLPAGERILVLPGFIHPGKGADRAVRAFEGPGRLVIVGAVKDRTPENLAHLTELRALADAAASVDLLERFVDDEDFDSWLVAADAVVLPYRRSWSSGVLARAQALGTPSIVTDVGGLAEQASLGDVVVHDDEGLREALAKVGLRAHR